MGMNEGRFVDEAEALLDLHPLKGTPIDATLIKKFPLNHRLPSGTAAHGLNRTSVMAPEGFYGELGNRLQGFITNSCVLESDWLSITNCPLDRPVEVASEGTFYYEFDLLPPTPGICIEGPCVSEDPRAALLSRVGDSRHWRAAGHLKPVHVAGNVAVVNGLHAVEKTSPFVFVGVTTQPKGPNLPGQMPLPYGTGTLDMSFAWCIEMDKRDRPFVRNPFEMWEKGRGPEDCFPSPATYSGSMSMQGRIGFLQHSMCERPVDVHLHRLPLGVGTHAAQCEPFLRSWESPPSAEGRIAESTVSPMLWPEEDRFQILDGQYLSRPPDNQNELYETSLQDSVLRSSYKSWRIVRETFFRWILSYYWAHTRRAVLWNPGRKEIVGEVNNKSNFGEAVGKALRQRARMENFKVALAEDKICGWKNGSGREFEGSLSSESRAVLKAIALGKKAVEVKHLDAPGKVQQLISNIALDTIGCLIHIDPKHPHKSGMAFSWNGCPVRVSMNYDIGCHWDATGSRWNLLESSDEEPPMEISPLGIPEMVRANRAIFPVAGGSGAAKIRCRLSGPWRLRLPNKVRWREGEEEEEGMGHVMEIKPRPLGESEGNLHDADLHSWTNMGHSRTPAASKG